MADGFEDKVIVVTGGASGIGAATVALLAGDGARVVSVDRSEATPEGAALCLWGDVGDAATVAAHAARIAERFGRFDGLVACAGYSNGKSVPDCPVSEWQDILQTNLTGTFLWAQAAVAGMRATGGGGAIVMIGSQLAMAGGRSNAAYLASKGAIVSLARTMAVDHAAEGIRVNVLVPGAIDTPLLNRAFARADDLVAQIVQGDGLAAGIIQAGTKQDRGLDISPTGCGEPLVDELFRLFLAGGGGDRDSRQRAARHQLGFPLGGPACGRGVRP
jgi:NAD(P)-dependent dehydrogenase (short-subunit alcohol dehydrogenase family)